MSNGVIKKNVIVEMTFEFSLKVIAFVDELVQRKKFQLSKQLFASATSIGANVREAQNPESKADFIHKIKIAMKEAEETEYWLMLSHHSKGYPDCEELLKDVKSIIKVLAKIITTSITKN